jgi:hypothetical protein
MTFKQAMIVPTMATLGIGALLMSHNLSLVEAVSAAPAAPQGAVGTMAPGPNASKGAELGMPSDGSISAEFGPQTGGKVIKAISDAELAHRAAESSGREDPFMALVPPDAGSIVAPPVTFGPIKPVPQMAALPPIGGAAVRPSPPPAVSLTQTISGKPTPKPVIDDLPFSGDRPPAVGDPQWLVRGIISTKDGRLTMLEGKDETVHAHVGDMLPDGSRVEAISSRGVTFSRGGRRFVKLIGGSN